MHCLIFNNVFPYNERMIQHTFGTIQAWIFIIRSVWVKQDKKTSCLIETGFTQVYTMLKHQVSAKLALGQYQVSTSICVASLERESRGQLAPIGQFLDFESSSTPLRTLPTPTFFYFNYNSNIPYFGDSFNFCYYSNNQILDMDKANHKYNSSDLTTTICKLP